MGIPPAIEHGANRVDAPSRAHYGTTQPSTRLLRDFSRPRFALQGAPDRSDLLPSTASPRSVRAGRVFDVAFCPWDDKLIASAGEDEAARLWVDAGSGAGVSSYGVCRGHKDEVVRVSWHPTSKILATASADGSVGVWRVAQPGMETSASAHDPDGGTTALVDKLEGHPDQVYGCIFVGDGEGGAPMLATAAGTDLHLWDLERAAVVTKVSHEPMPVEAGSERWEPGFLFSLASDGGARNLLASACSDGAVRIFAHDSKASSAEIVATLPVHTSALGCATTFLSGGNVLASMSTDGAVVFTDVRTMTPMTKVTSPCPTMGCCAVPSGDDGSIGSWFAMCGTDGIIRAIDMEGSSAPKVLIQPTDRPVPLLCVAADHSGRRIAAAGKAPEAPQGTQGAGGLGGFGGVGMLGAKKTPSSAGILLWDAAGRS